MDLSMSPKRSVLDNDHLSQQDRWFTQNIDNGFPNIANQSFRSRRKSETAGTKYRKKTNQFSNSPTKTYVSPTRTRHHDPPINSHTPPIDLRFNEIQG